MAEAAGLHAVAADLHRAPGARAVARLVVEGDAAVLVAAGLQALPVVGRREFSHRRDDAAECPAGSVVLGSEDGAAAVETDTEVRLPTASSSVCEAAAASISTPLFARSSSRIA